MMKKLASLFIAAVLLLVYMLPVTAQGAAATVYADSVTIEAGQQLTVTVKITGNPGLMGYAITLRYDSAVLTPLSAAKGTAFPGMFNDSIGTSPAGSFRVVWTGTDDVTANATLFTATFKAAAGAAPGRMTIALSYSQADTFNSSWQDVALNMNDIAVTVTGHSFGEWIVDQAATTSAEGQRHRVCTTCGYTQTETIPKLAGNGYQQMIDLIKNRILPFIAMILSLLRQWNGTKG